MRIAGETWRWGFFLSMVLACPAFAQQPAAPRGRYATQLAAECEELLRFAVRRPYGWGWERVASPSWEKKTLPRVVSFEPQCTPAAGMILWHAGRLLNESRYTQAAIEAARGIAAAQKPNGRIPALRTFGSSVGGREESAAVPDRSATCASMGLILNILDGGAERNPRFEQVAKLAAAWLGGQQTPIGGWPEAYPPDAGPDDAQRLLRLDSCGFRDSTFAMLLAGEILPDEPARKRAAKAVQLLLKLRFDQAEAAGRGLWTTVYNANGSPALKLREFPQAVDLVASRYAMQTLLGACLSGVGDTDAAALKQAAGAIAAFAPADGRWNRLYGVNAASPLPMPGIFAGPDEEVEPPPPPPPPPASQPSGIAGSMGLQRPAPPPPTSRPKYRREGVRQSFLDEARVPVDVLRGVADLKKFGIEQYKVLMEAHFSGRQQMSHALCGLSDSPLLLDLPVLPGEAEAFLKRHEMLYGMPQGFPLSELPERLRRLWILLIRAKVEAAARR